jgi:hypothetical protein
VKAISEAEFEVLTSVIGYDEYVTFAGGELCECGDETITVMPFPRIVIVCECGIMLDIWMEERNA